MPAAQRMSGQFVDMYMRAWPVAECLHSWSAIAGNALAPVAVPWMGLAGQSSELMIRAFRVASWTTG